MICRSCNYPMGQKILDGQLLDICQACGAIWIDRHELGPLLREPGEPPDAKQLLALKQDLEWSAAHDGAPQRNCPKCAKAMHRNLFASLSGIAIDYCGKDGIWCDPSELDRLRDFIAKGGMQLARLKRLEEALPIEPADDAKPLPRILRILHRAAGVFGGHNT